jgi:hypothetical protein
VSFLLICFVFMFHNTLYRDRTFLLFLGMRDRDGPTGSAPARARSGGVP